MKRVEVVSVKGCASMYADPCEMIRKFPLVADFLLNEEHEDCSERKVGVLIIRADQGQYAVTAKEPSSCVMLRYNASTWLEVLVNLEALLSAPKPPWQVDQFEQDRRVGSKKKSR